MKTPANADQSPPENRPARPPIDVVIVNYNGGEGLTECVGRVLQSRVPVAVAVVDNASRDDSMARLAAAHGDNPALSLHSNARNVGFAAAVNQIPCAGDYLLVLNPDCYLAPDTLARFRDLLERHPKAGMAGGLVRNLDGTAQNACRREVPTPGRSLVRVLHLDRLIPGLRRFDRPPPNPNQAEPVDGISGACMFVRQQALQQVGPLDEEYFLHCEDLDWFMRFRGLGWQIWFDPTIEVTHVKGACSHGNPVRVLWYKHRGMLRFYNKFFRHHYPLPLAWAVTVAVWLRFALLAGPAWLRRGFSPGPFHGN